MLIFCSLKTNLMSNSCQTVSVIVGSVCVIVFMLQRRLLSWEGLTIFQHKVSRKILSDGETRSWSMLRIGSDINKVWKDCPFKKQLFFHLHSTCEADIWWRDSTHPKKKPFGWKSPISTYFGRCRGRKSKVWKLMKNSLIFSEESFEFKKIKPNEQRHVHKASESSKNPFLYPNFKSKSFITNLLLASWPFKWYKKLKCFIIHYISWFFK